MVPPILLLAACNGCAPATETVPVAAACPPDRTDDPSPGDANGDGTLDVSDSVYALRWLLGGGPRPQCDGALDLVNDDQVDIADATMILYALFVGGENLPEKVRDACTESSGVPDGECGEVGVAVVAEASVTGATGATVSFPATVQVRAPTLAVDAWSFGVEASGCTITGATADGTVAADARLDGAGRRDRGFERTDLLDGGVVSATVLSWREDVDLAASDSPYTVLAVTVEAPVGDACATCTVKPTGELRGAGENVPLVLTAAGQSYAPLATAAAVEICPG